MNSTLPADLPDNVNNEENYTTSDHIVQPPTGLSAEDVQQIATAVASLVGGPSSSSNNPLASGPSQVPTPPTTGTEIVYCVIYSWSNFNPASLSGLSRITKPMWTYSTFLSSALLVLFFLNLLNQHGAKIYHFEIT